MRHNLAWLLLLCALLPGLTQAPLSADRLARADRLLEQAEQGGDAQRLLREAARLLPSGAVPGLGPALNTPTRSALSRVRREVAALRQVSAPPTRGGITAKDARQALRTVLAQRAYQPLRKSHVPKPMRRVGAWVKKAWHGFWGAIGKGIMWVFREVGKLFSRMHLNIRPPRAPHLNVEWLNQLGAGMKTFLWILLVMLVLFLVAVIVSRFMIVWRRRQAEEGEVEASLSPLTNRKQEPTYWERALTRAEELWSAGDEREAVRMVSRACLVLLDARGVLRYDEARANGEVLRELRRQGKGDVAETMRPIVRCVDRSWYGLLPVSEDEFATVLETSRRFRDSVVGEG